MPVSINPSVGGEELARRVVASLREAGTMHPTHQAMKHVFDAISDEIKKAISGGEEVLLFGLGKVKLEYRASRRFSDPRNGKVGMTKPKYRLRLRESTGMVRLLKLKLEADEKNGEVPAAAAI